METKDIIYLVIIGVIYALEFGMGEFKTLKANSQIALIRDILKAFLSIFKRK